MLKARAQSGNKYQNYVVHRRSSLLYTTMDEYGNKLEVMKSSGVFIMLHSLPK